MMIVQTLIDTFTISKRTRHDLQVMHHLILEYHTGLNFTDELKCLHNLRSKRYDFLYN